MRAGLLAVAIAVGTAGAAHADSYWHWFDPALYPARVTGIHFFERLDAGHAPRWGAWTVRLSGDAAMARFIAAPGAPRIEVTGLTCLNAVTGPRACTFVFVRTVGDNFVPLLCSLSIDAPAQPSLSVGCPSYMEMAE
jgi:hypothetical protein